MIVFNGEFFLLKSNALRPVQPQDTEITGAGTTCLEFASSVRCIEFLAGLEVFTVLILI